MQYKHANRKSKNVLFSELKIPSRLRHRTTKHTDPLCDLCAHIFMRHFWSSKKKKFIQEFDERLSIHFLSFLFACIQQQRDYSVVGSWHISLNEHSMRIAMLHFIWQFNLLSSIVVDIPQNHARAHILHRNSLSSAVRRLLAALLLGK